MKKNNKGFTLVELLGVMTIMGILMVVAIPAVTKYLTRSRNTSTDTMVKSAYEAMENYMMDNDVLIGVGSSQTFDVSDLVKEQYLEPLKDPIGNEARCDGSGSTVVVKRDNNTTGGLINYKYTVTIKCPQSGTLIYTFPKDDMVSVMLDAAESYAKENKWYDSIASGTTKTVSYTTLKTAGKFTEIKDASGNSCNSSSSKVTISYADKNFKYQVNLLCGGKTYTGTYAFK